MKKLLIIALLFVMTAVSYSQMGMMIRKGERVLPFISTWTTTAPAESITLPLLSSGGQYDFTVDWGDGTAEQITTNSASHSFASAGTQTITINGLINGWRFNDGGDKLKITDISQWGCLQGAGNAAFYGCNNLDVSATDPLNTEGITDFSLQFALCYSLTSLDVSNWDVSEGIDFNRQFFSCNDLTSLDVSNWDVSKCTDFSWQFGYCTKLTTLDVSIWDVSEGINFEGQFRSCLYLTSLDVSDWDVSKGEDFTVFMLGTGMTTANYNQTLINWSTKLQFKSNPLDFGNSKYNLAPNPAAGARAFIEALGWTITDGGGI